MSLTESSKLLMKAAKEKYAIPAFNFYNLETLQGIVEVAEIAQAPVILQASESTINYAGMNYIYNLVKTTGDKISLPLVLHLDHAKSLDIIEQAIEIGFNSVMIDSSREAFEENVMKTKEVVETAKPKGIQVEAELGKVGRGDEKVQKEFLTAPAEAEEFVKRTGVDSLAVAIGTAHGLYKGEPKIDFERLKEIRSRVDIPLVLHGGSDVPDEDIRRVIKGGICKVNIATELKIAFLNGIKENLVEGASNIREVLTEGKEAMKEVVREKIKLLGTKKYRSDLEKSSEAS